ncbi:unnamed protein product [Paramecium sonneborni]|uniref:Uncharacterized protein n=1 Tax=Paramecium sonneborni TaxID=65129 RepID=A0A8S1KJR7_9CILI|nr:unnamed protein product [Paramecium sonneborni]
MYQEEGQKNIIQQEQIYILKFQNSNNTEEEIIINERIMKQLEPVKNAVQNQGIDEKIFYFHPNQQFNPDIYKILQEYIDIHKNDEIIQNQQQQEQVFCFSKKLENIISERDYTLMHTLKRQQLQDLACLAEYLMYNALVDLIMKIILFYLAGKNQEQITRWLQSD